MRVGGLSIEVVRKDIKNLHLGVYPPRGRVRVAAPISTSDEAIRLAVVGKLAWIRRQRAKFAEQPRQSRRELITGESHYFLGRRYLLSLEETTGPQAVRIATKTRMELHVRHDSNPDQRLRVLERWYRDQLRDVITPMIDQWQDTLGAIPDFVGVKRMKTKWGSCNAATSRLWFNSELAKKPLPCIEFIVVHELIHLIQPTHDGHFVALMDQHLPDWRARRSQLNRSPLANEDWEY